MRTLAEMREAIKELGVSASDLFSPEEMQADPVVADIIRKEKQTEYEHARRLERRLGEERERLLAIEAKISEVTAEGQRNLLRASSIGHITAKMEAMGLSETAAKFILFRAKKFTTEADTEEQLKGDVAKFIKEQLGELEQTCADLGKECQLYKEDAPADPARPNGLDEKFLDPDRNPMIYDEERAGRLWDPDDPQDMRNPANNRLIPDHRKQDKRPDNPLIPR